MHAMKKPVDGWKGDTRIVGERGVWREEGRVVFCECGVACVEAPPGNTTSILRYYLKIMDEAPPIQN